MRNFIFSIVSFFIYAVAVGQEVVSPINYNSALIYKNNAATKQPASSQKRSSLSLPFFDDFAYKSLYPDGNLWVDSFVYINDNLQANPISYGVATFDGLNQFGLAYDVTTPNAYVAADTLTSQPIDLSVFLIEDTTIYLSFFYQAMGVGDWPNEEDSLLLEFKTLGDNWKEVWAVGGFSARPDTTAYQIVMLRLDDPFYFVTDFQFRFRNYATSGNNDHWHIDYVYLNANRTIADTVMRDISVIGKPSRILKNYTSMPWNQFVDNQLDETETDFLIYYRNNWSVDQNMPFTYEVEESFSGTPLDNGALVFSPFPPFTYFQKDYPTSGFIPLMQLGDSVLLTVKQYLDNVPSTPSFLDNDTSFLHVPFYNYLAYDDGTAEKAYGLEGPGLKKFAYEFNLNKGDSLRAVQIHFTQINKNMSNFLFSLYVWDDINFVTEIEDTLYQKDFLKPIYVDSINGFATYVLDEPVYVEAGKFYIGWQQAENENIQIGLDIHNSAKTKMNIYANGTWFTSSVNAAPMIRPVLGKDVEFINTSVKDIQQETFVVYPNPASEFLKLRVKSLELKVGVVEMFDLSGKQILSSVVNSENDIINITEIPTGTYIVHLKDATGTNYRPQRFIKLN
jgi:hypothetical protein